MNFCKGYAYYEDYFGKFKDDESFELKHFHRPHKNQFEYWMRLAYLAGYRNALKELKANELMIGDWVCYDGDTDYECPLRLCGLHDFADNFKIE